MLYLMSENGGTKMRHEAMVMQTKIFYDRTLFLDKVVNFVRTFDAGKQPKSYGNLFLLIYFALY